MALRVRFKTFQWWIQRESSWGAFLTPLIQPKAFFFTTRTTPKLLRLNNFFCVNVTTIKALGLVISDRTPYQKFLHPPLLASTFPSHPMQNVNLKS